jgi:hypothetical protein
MRHVVERLVVCLGYYQHMPNVYRLNIHEGYGRAVFVTDGCLTGAMHNFAEDARTVR